MILTITLNPAIDKMIEVENLQPGQVHRIKKVVKNLGGKGLNISRILAGLKVDSQALCFVGKNNQAQVMAYAKTDAIDLVSQEVAGETRTNVKMIEPDQDYRTTDLNEPGFSIDKAALDQMLATIKAKASQADYLVISGSLPQGVPSDFYGRLARELKETVKVVVDADGQILQEAMEGSPFMIKPNIHELESVLGQTLKSQGDILRAVKKIKHAYNIPYVLVSMGGDGSLLVTDQAAYQGDIIPGDVVNTVGAGDSMLAGFLYGLQEKDSPEEALKKGVASSSLAIRQTEHVQFDPGQLNAQAAQVEIHKLTFNL